MQEIKKIIPLDYQTPLPAEEHMWPQEPPVSASVRQRQVFFAAGFAFLFAGLFHILNHQADGRIEVIYGGMLAVPANPFFKLRKK